MQPIRKFDFNGLESNLEKKFFKIHNQVVDDLTILQRTLTDQAAISYIQTFLSQYPKLDWKKNSLSDTIICCSREEVCSIVKNRSDAALSSVFPVDSVENSDFSSTLSTLLKNHKKTANEISLSNILLGVFNYPGHRPSLLRFYAAKNHFVCCYCLAQSTLIYKSRRNQKYYLTGNLDHSDPKDKNPFVSISLNNLVPVCGPCNQRKLNREYHYDPFNIDHRHSFDFSDCIVTNGTQVNFSSITLLKIDANDKKHKDLSTDLDYIDLYSKFESNAKLLVDRFKVSMSDGYKEHLNNTLGTPVSRDRIEYFVSEIPLTEENVLSYPLTKFKMDLFAELKRKAGLP